MVRSGPETTRTELLYAAALEIAERGYSGASFSSVAARLGLTKGAFAYHFPTKQALAVALMEEFDETFSNAVAHAREDFPSDDLRTALFALREIEAKADTEPVVAAAFILMCDPQPPVEEIHETFRRWIATFIEFLQNAKASAGRVTGPLEDAATSSSSPLGLTNLSHRTFARSSAKDQMHRLLFSALGVSNTEALITEVLGVPQP